MYARWNHSRFANPGHARNLVLYLVVVLAHWLEHLCQMYQIYVLGWMPKAAGGVLGLWYPWLASSEVLHFAYNFLLWAGLVALRCGFQGRARRWWMVALGLQSVHHFEHLLLFVQGVSGVYFFGAAESMSIGQLWVRRPELHFMYNLAVFVPMMVAVWYYWQDGNSCECKVEAKQPEIDAAHPLSAS